MKGIRMEIQLVRNWRLLWALVRRDLRMRYIGSIMGLFWSVINPLILLIIYIFIFSLIFQFGGDSEPAGGAGPAAETKRQIVNFPVFLCCGLLPWNALMEALLGATAIIAGSGGLIKKAVFPTAILPMQSIVASFVNLLITMCLLGVFLVVIDVAGIFPGSWPGWKFLLILPLMALQFALIVGPCYFFATVNVFFRDMGQILAAVMNFLFWATPIVYPARLATERLPWIEVFYFLNPFTHLIRLYREALYVDRSAWTQELSCSTTTSVVYLLAIGALAYIAGKYIFTRSQPHFVDEV
mgnify:CR=1 FL=1